VFSLNRKNLGQGIYTEAKQGHAATDFYGKNGFSR